MVSPIDEPARVDVLAALGWDLRALGEAQIRSITAMQRCIEDYRHKPDSNTLWEIRKHINAMATRSQEAKESFQHLLHVLDGIEAARPSDQT